jgi:hypothetical protein
MRLSVLLSRIGLYKALSTSPGINSFAFELFGFSRLREKPILSREVEGARMRAGRIHPHLCPYITLVADCHRREHLYVTPILKSLLA